MRVSSGFVANMLGEDEDRLYDVSMDMLPEYSACTFTVSAVASPPSTE